jgi:hypothetical protein
MGITKRAKQFLSTYYWLDNEEVRVRTIIVLSCPSLALLTTMSPTTKNQNIFSVLLKATIFPAEFSGLSYPMVHMMHNSRVSEKLLMGWTSWF